MSRFSARLCSLATLLAAATLCGALAACVSGSDETPKPGAARFGALLENPKWYRAFDSTSNIATETTLVFSWAYADSLRRTDSFYVGIDTLWMLPQNVDSDTSISGDWDLQLCPDGANCLGGIASGVQGGNAPYPFGKGADTFATEHHVQFFPALKPNLAYGVSPDSAIFGGLMFVQSRTGKSPSDTVLVYGSWKIPWDDVYTPPSKPVDGYLPERSDFAVVNGKWRYLK
jgi:hypothetical protein